MLRGQKKKFVLDGAEVSEDKKCRGSGLEKQVGDVEKDKSKVKQLVSHCGHNCIWGVAVRQISASRPDDCAFCARVVSALVCL